MSITIRRGDPCTLKFVPTNGMSMTDLDDGGMAITQELELIVRSGDEVTITSEGMIVVLSAEDTMLLVDGAKTEIQAFFAVSEEESIRFPIEDVIVLPPAIGIR